MITRLNRKLVGWANYFCSGAATDAYRTVDRHVRRRLRRWLCAKHKVRNTGISRFPDAYLERTLGLVRLETRRRNFSRANA